MWTEETIPDWDEKRSASSDIKALSAWNNQVAFVTGGSGFLGSALIYRLVLDCGIEKVFVLYRGGSERLFDVWSKRLSPTIAHRLRSSGKIIPVNGDIEKPNLGLSPPDLRRIQQQTNFIIHSASSLNLKSKLARLMPSVVEASLAMTDLALSCPNLDRFVYVSTAYANANRHDPLWAEETFIEEKIYPLTPNTDTFASASEELSQARQNGQVPASQSFPFTYGYAKHLTERLIMNAFKDSPEKLLIIRPSIIGPAEQSPFPGYEVPGSSPITSFAAGVCIDPGLTFKAASPFENSDSETYSDEVPVDVVVNRLLMSLSHGQSGIIHAVAGRAKRVPTGILRKAMMKERKLFWKQHFIWKKVDWHCRDLHFIARLFMVIGTAYDFDETRSRSLWQSMSAEERQDFPLFTQRDPSNLDLSSRRVAIRANVDTFLAKKGWPLWIKHFTCRRPVAVKA
ncbi:hypothetical protein MBLNU457_7559t1 [Dothideomycetes sp. NU457]